MDAFLTHLAVDRHVSASTQNQALAALGFLYREILGRRFSWLDGIVRARRPRRLRDHLNRLWEFHRGELRAGKGRVKLSEALAVKYTNAGSSCRSNPNINHNRLLRPLGKTTLIRYTALKAALTSFIMTV